MEQVLILSERAMLVAWPSVWTWSNFALYLAQTLLAGILWLPQRDNFSEDSLFARMSFVFWVVGTWTFFPLFGCLMLFDSQLSNLRKELSVASYSLFAYFTAVTSVLIPLDFLWTLVYVPVTYWMANLGTSAAAFFGFFASLLLNILVMQALGLLIAAAFLGTHQAFPFSISLVTFFFGFGGLFVPLSDMGWTAYLRFINFLSYSFHLHMEAVFGLGIELSDNYTCSSSGSSSFPQCPGFNNTRAVGCDGAAAATTTAGPAADPVITGADVLDFFEIPADAVLVSLCASVAGIVGFRALAYGVLHAQLVSDGALDDRLHGSSSDDGSGGGDEGPDEQQQQLDEKRKEEGKLQTIAPPPAQTELVEVGQ